ncbi:MAG: DUF2059 domain-containing protein [Flavobacteriaceae bacterium]|nr:DUF2059 domain-containing protein [Flavobacteriaceae bacterium]
MRSTFLTLFSLICFSGFGQVDAFQQDIIDYLKVNGTQAQYSEAYDEMFTVLKKNFETANVPENVWQDLRTNKSESLDDVIEFLTFAYRKHFTQDDIHKMEAFYRTEAAQKMIRNTGDLSEKEHKAISAYYESDVAKKVDSKKVELANDISEISSHWSRDLFSAKMSALIKMGYVPHQ